MWPLGSTSNLEPEFPKPCNLGDAVGEKPDALQAQFSSYLGSNPIVPEVRGEPKALVRLDGVETLHILEVVGLHLVEEPYAPPLMLHVDDDSLALDSALHLLD